MSRCLDTDIDPKCLWCILTEVFYFFAIYNFLGLDSINRFSREVLIICLRLLIMLALDNSIFRERKTVRMN